MKVNNIVIIGAIILLILWYLTPIKDPSHSVPNKTLIHSKVSSFDIVSPPSAADSYKINAAFSYNGKKYNSSEYISKKAYDRIPKGYPILIAFDKLDPENNYLIHSDSVNLISGKRINKIGTVTEVDFFEKRMSFGSNVKLQEVYFEYYIASIEAYKTTIMLCDYQFKISKGDKFNLISKDKMNEECYLDLSRRLK